MLLLLLLLLPPLLLQTSQPPDGTWLNAGSVMLCLARSLIARPSAPPFDAASMGNRSGRQMFAYGCPLNLQNGVSLSSSLVYASCATEYWGLQCLHCPHSLPYIVHWTIQPASLVGRDIQSCGYTYIPETHIHHLPHRARQGLAWLAYHSTTWPHNLPCLPVYPFPFPSLALPCPAVPFRVCCDGRPRKGPRLPFAFGHAVRNEIHIKQNRSDRCNAGPRFAPCPGLPGVLDLSCLPPFHLLPGSPRRALLPDAIASSRHMHDTPLLLRLTRVFVCVQVPVSPVGSATLHSNTRFFLFSGRYGHHHWSFVCPTSRPELQDCFWSGACREAFVSGWDEFSVRQ